MAATAALRQIQSTTADPDIKAAATLLLAFNTMNSEIFFEGQPVVNTLLLNRGYTQNKNNSTTIETGLNTRYAYVDPLSSLFLDIQELFPALEQQYSPELLLVIFTKAVEKLATREGHKSFDNRASRFVAFLRACLRYRFTFTDEEFKKLLNNDHLFDVLLYNKDWQQTLQNVNVSKYKNLVNTYKLTKQPFLQLLLNIYAKEKVSSPQTAQANFAKVVSKLIREQSIDKQEFRSLLTKFLPEHEVETIISIPLNLKKESNISGEKCLPSELEPVACPSGKLLQLCPASKKELEIGEFDLNFYCSHLGGGRRKTRKQKKRAKRTRRR